MMTGGENCDVMIFRPNRRSDHPERAYLLLGGGLLLLGGGLLWGRNGGEGGEKEKKWSEGSGGVRRIRWVRIYSLDETK